MRRALVCLVTVGVVVACDPHAPAHYPSREEDRAAWTNAPLIELETHEKFASLPHEERQLSDGSMMWLVPECRNGKTTCRGGSVAIGHGALGGATCDTSDPSCCYHRFFVRDGVVERYEVVGEGYTCRSNCATRPKTVRAACER